MSLTDFLASPNFRKLLTSFITFLMLYGVLRAVRRILKVTVSDEHLRYRRSKLAYYTFGGLAVLIIGTIWMESAGRLVTILGITGAGVALALHPVVMNVAGWLYIVLIRPLRVGDRVEIGKVKGDVIDVRLFHTVLLEVGNWVEGEQSTGRIVYCPNSLVLSQPLYNYSKEFPYIWDEIKVLVTFESDWRKAHDILLRQALEKTENVQEELRGRFKDISDKYLIRFTKLTPIVYVGIEDSGVGLTLRYLTDVWKRRLVGDVIAQGILDAFSREPDVDFAYPTYRIYRLGEKGGTDAP
ncbi:MAG: mechanosensitive ion channel family protein [Candidatus Latescibacterota bacterium]|nr:MAG: mechanosensitive ion channel family protein [Candidatus Latescibacterota bacterium]